MILSFDAFCNSEKNSLTWYDWLPGDDITVTDIPQHNATEAVNCLLSLPAITETELTTVDFLAATFLSAPYALSDISADALQSLSRTLSFTMSAQLTTKGVRSVRMSCQRLHYYIQHHLAKNEPAPEELAEIVLSASKPWDSITHLGKHWCISSDETFNISTLHARPEKTHRYKEGLPTQADIVDEQRLSIGSIYSNGLTIIDGEAWQHVAHDAPLLLCFSYEGSDYFLDHFGSVYRDQMNTTFSQLPLDQVHFARYFDGVLYCLNNGDFGHITSFNLATQEVKRIDVMPVMVCNDMVATGDAFYLIDKQQGSIFKYSKDWVYQTSRLSFGRGHGQLLDPVSLRLSNDQLQIVSWLSGKLTTLALF